ncbi:serine/threonine protein kinase [Nannocystis radixulma]|uniref:Protein kinase n=1 Tax=Nannocystis radixulma TaxID=2995305 RepID=A0ABT5AYC9_9BACT|nr:serine/threonine-protein kinase [Nannocystis radixulma]MDC0666841.1 protein kinase [Nannocystis radixulma]
MTSDERSRGSHAPKFRRLAAVGHGGMADIYLAAARGVGGALKLLVLKDLRPALVRDPEYRAMFQREARIATLLSHPNVVQTYEVGSEDGRPFIAMEYLEGQPLHRVLRRMYQPPPLPPGLPTAMHLRILAELLAGLHYVHELCDYDGRPLGLVHRDVSPHNVLVTYDGQIKLVDFGIARLAGDGDTEIGTFKGKAAYSSPEQVCGEAVDRRSDLFSVGVMLWEALARQRMWVGLDELTIARKLEDGEVPALPADAVATPALRSLCASALAVDPARRPATAEAFREALELHLGKSAPSPRAIGAMLADIFAEDRANLRGLVEAQIRRARQAHDDLPVLDLSDPSGLAESGPGDLAHPDEPTRRDAPRAAEAPQEPSPPRPSGPHDATWSGVAAPVRRPTPAPRWLPWALGAGAVAVSASMVFTTGSREHVDPDMSAEPAVLEPCARADKPVVELSGEIEHSARLTCDKTYRLRFVTFVRPGATLTIDPGTTIVGDRDTGGTLVVQPGAKLVAEGTRERPIVFTSEARPGLRRAGDWGGLIVLGKAPTNLRDADGRPARGRVEGIADGGEYGGDDPEDSSGTLRYVRVEYSGTELGPNNEINGVTFAGVGRGTLVDHVQVRHTADDCFEFFGGTVDAKHLICQDPGDDGFDWDLGYSGRLQFLLLRDGAEALDTTAGLEGDNDPGGSRNEPRSAPTIFNATLCGRGHGLEHEHYGMLLRRGTAATIGNAVVVGFEAPLDLRDRDTTVALRGGLWLARNFAAPLAHAEVPGGELALADDDFGVDEAALLAAAGARVEDPDLPGCADPASLKRFKPRAPLHTGAAAPPADGFFAADADFAGAFRDEADDWDAGWAVWADAPEDV